MITTFFIMESNFKISCLIPNNLKQELDLHNFKCKLKVILIDMANVMLISLNLISFLDHVRFTDHITSYYF